MGEAKIGSEVPENIRFRREDLASGIKYALKAIPVYINEDDNEVTVHFQELFICGAVIENEGYKIYNASEEWANTTTYLCEKAEDGKWFYYLESIDECIGEVQRLVMFEATKGKKKLDPIGHHKSQLSKVLTADQFEITFKHFLIQADRCAKQGVITGSTQIPYGFQIKPFCDGAEVCTHFGQGAVSASPYLNWWVVSIYYLPKSKNIIMGIEENRYPHLKEMKIKPLRYDQIGNKRVNTAVFYSASKNSLNYKDLHKKFIQVCEEVMRLGLK